MRMSATTVFILVLLSLMTACSSSSDDHRDGGGNVDDAGVTDHDGGIVDPDGGNIDPDGGLPDEDGGVLADGGDDAGVTNQQPSLPAGMTHVAGLPDATTAFSLSPVDPEGDTFSVSFKGCAKNQGTIELCKTADCSAKLTLDCSVPYSASNPAVLLDVALPLKGSFTAGAVSDFASANAYNTIYLVFDDDASALAAADTAVVFDVRIVNHAPTILLNSEDVATKSFVVDISAPFRPEIIVADPDFENQDSYLMSIELTVDNPDAPFDTTGLNAALIDDCRDSAVLTPSLVKYTCNLPNINAFLAQFSMNSSSQQLGEESQVHVKVDDLGFYGQCDSIPTFDETPCPLQDELTMDLTYAQTAP